MQHVAKLGVEFFIVGAIAKNIWLVSNQECAAGTKDIDIGIYVTDESKYNKLRKILIKKFGYVVSSENPFCLLTRESREINLLSFGKFSRAD